MADGDHSLPSNEELFEQQEDFQQQQQQHAEDIEMHQPQDANQQPGQYELAEQFQPLNEGQHNVAESDAAVVAPMVQEVPMDNGEAYIDQLGHGDHDEHYYNDAEEELEEPNENIRIFQPNVYVPPPGGQVPQGMPDADENTVWIDSEDDDPRDEAERILKENFFLPYSDHNYDPADPADRVIQPSEGPFPIIEGLDEQGRITKQYMPPGFEHLDKNYVAPEPEQPIQQQPEMYQPQQPQAQSPPHVHLLPPPRGRPVNTAAPFSIGGNQVEYAEPQQQQRVPPQRGVLPQGRETQYRVYNDYAGSPMVAVPPRGQSVSNRPPPAATIIRQAPRGVLDPNVYQSPARTIQGQQRAASIHPSPGSYQHIMSPSPVGAAQVRRVVGAAPQPQQQPQQPPRGVSVGPGIMTGMRPIGRPQPQQRGIVDMQEREFAEHPLPLPTQANPARRVIDMAPHRMTQEQRQEQQQQMNRQRALFPAGTRPGPRPAAALGTVIGRRVPGSSPAHPGQEELTRSPQRAAAPIHEPRRFQVKVTDTYSTPIPKASDQLPAQLTEDPDEPSTSNAIREPEMPENIVQEEAPAETMEETKSPVIKSPARIPSAATSPMKTQHLGPYKPTPPHRMTQEEKSAHFAKLATDKEKPVQGGPSSSTPSSSSSHHHHHQPPPPHQLRHDDPLAVVQSVFDKPREPDTPRDKAEISKIADELRFSADKFAVQPPRQRSISGGRQGYPMPHPHQQQQMHHQPPQNPMDMMGPDGRKRHGSGRYEMSMGVGGIPQQRPIPPHMQNQAPPEEPTHHRHPEAGLEPPHRPRGRPRGATGAQHRGRWPSGQEPIAPHRAAGGARTLPPRQQAAPPEPQQQQPAPPPPPPPTTHRNGGAQNNSDSESEGIEEESWEMRCHCEMDHGDGATIECEACKSWQHQACMGLTPKSDTSNYKCEICQPRRLPVTKAEAIKIQKKLLDKLIKAAAKEKREKRKSEPVESAHKKQQQQPSTSRKSAPMPIQQQAPPPIHRVPQLNEYSKSAAALLNSMPQTAGADTLLEESRRHKKARRMFVEENVEALVTTEVVGIRQVILEVNGYVSMASEVKRQPGGGNCIFMYDGLMKGTSGEDIAEVLELVCIDAKKKGNDTRFTRRSCIPNCVLKHVLGQNATLGIMIVATKDVHRNIEVTLPFDADWKDSDVPLECAEHSRDMHSCLFETERRRIAADRQRGKDSEQRKAEEARRAAEEKRRLEEEVRRERAAKTRQMDEEAEKERLEAEREKKAKEREEAKKKRDAEKKKEAEKKEAAAEKEKKELQEKKEAQEKQKAEKKQQEAERKKAEEEAAPKVGECSRTSEVSARDERKARNAEELFRRQEEDEKRREANKRRSMERAKSKTPEDGGPSTSGTASSTNSANRRVSARQQKHQDSVEDSDEVVAPKTPAQAKSAAAPRSNKRMSSVVQAAPTPASKRPRASTVMTPTVPLQNQSKKRAAADEPVSTSAKRNRAGLVAATMNSAVDDNAALSRVKKSSTFSLPSYSKDALSSIWARNLKGEDFPKEIGRENRENEIKRAQKAKQRAAEKEKEDIIKTLEKNVEKKKEKTPEPVVVAPKVETPKAPEAPKTPARAPEVPKAPAPVSAPKAAPAPLPVPVVKAPAPVVKAPAPAAPAPAPTFKPAEDNNGFEREASQSTEGSVEKEMTSSSSSSQPPKLVVVEKKTPVGVTAEKKKVISLEQYNRRNAQKLAASSSTTPVDAAAPRQGFIPSTEGVDLANVQLSAIPLDDHPSNISTTTTAPSGPGAPGAPGTTITTPSAPRARGAPSESSADDAPVEHQMKLADRISAIFGTGTSSS